MSNPSTKRPLDVNAEKPEMVKKPKSDNSTVIKPPTIQDFLKWLPSVNEGLQAACDRKEKDYQKLQQKFAEMVAEFEESEDSWNREYLKYTSAIAEVAIQKSAIIASESALKCKVLQLEHQLSQEKSRNNVFSLDKRKIVSDMLEKNKEWLDNFERSELRAKVAFKEMNRARKKNGDPVYSKEEFEKVVERYI